MNGLFLKFFLIILILDKSLISSFSNNITSCFTPTLLYLFDNCENKTTTWNCPNQGDVVNYPLNFTVEEILSDGDGYYMDQGAIFDPYNHLHQHNTSSKDFAVEIWIKPTGNMIMHIHNLLLRFFTGLDYININDGSKIGYCIGCWENIVMQQFIFRFHRLELSDPNTILDIFYNGNMVFTQSGFLLNHFSGFPLYIEPYFVEEKVYKSVIWTNFLSHPDIHVLYDLGEGYKSNLTDTCFEETNCTNDYCYLECYEEKVDLTNMVTECITIKNNLTFLYAECVEDFNETLINNIYYNLYLDVKKELEDCVADKAIVENFLLDCVDDNTTLSEVLDEHKRNLSYMTTEIFKRCDYTEGDSVHSVLDCIENIDAILKKKWIYVILILMGTLFLGMILVGGCLFFYQCYVLMCVVPSEHDDKPINPKHPFRYKELKETDVYKNGNDNQLSSPSLIKITHII
jgi:hypothetical protein